MSYSLRLHPAAQRELNEAVAYYDAESPGLGAAFIDEIEHALQQMRAFPEAAPPASGLVRNRVMTPAPRSIPCDTRAGLLQKGNTAGNSAE